MTTLPQSTPFYGGRQSQNPCTKFQGTGAPSGNIAANLGDIYTRTSNGTIYGAASKSGSTITWTILGGGTGAVATETGDTGTATPSAGNIKHAGTPNQITTAASGATITYTLPVAITAPGSISATTTMTATLGAITATNGNFVGSTAGTGLLFNANTASGAASGTVTLNSRAGKVTFTTVSIAAGADLTLTMGNSQVTGSGTQILYFMSGATSGAALSIKSVTNSASSSAIVVTNGTGATTTTADISFTFLVIN